MSQTLRTDVCATRPDGLSRKILADRQIEIPKGDDARRVRATAVQVLKNAATAGHMLLTVNDLLSENHRDGKPANSRR